MPHSRFPAISMNFGGIPTGLARRSGSPGGVLALTIRVCSSPLVSTGPTWGTTWG